MKKKIIAVISILTLFIFQASCFAAPKEIKCIQNPIIPKDSSIIYYNNINLVAYAKNSQKYTVIDIAHNAKVTQYTISKNEHQVGNDGQYMLLRYENSGTYTYFSLNMLTGRQVQLIKTTINLHSGDYVLINEGKILISSNLKLIANGAIGKSMTDVQFAKNIGLGYGTPKKYPNSIYIWENDSLKLLNLSTMNVTTALINADDSSLLWIPNTPKVNMPAGFTDEYSVLNKSTNEAYFPNSNDKETIVLTDIPTDNITAAAFNSSKNKIALVSNNKVLYIYDVNSKSIEQTIKITKNINSNKIFWSCDDTTIMSLNETNNTSVSDSNIYAIKTNKTISIYPGVCTDLTLSNQGIRFTLSEDWMEYAASYNTKTGMYYQSILRGPSLADPKPGIVLQKSKDFSITTNSRGIPAINSKRGWKIIDSDATQSSNYWFIANSKANGFYIYNVTNNMLYHSNYKITTELDLKILNNGKYALVRAKTKAGTQYFNVFLLQ